MKIKLLLAISILLALISCKKDEEATIINNIVASDSNAVYLDSNGVTIKAYDWAKVGDTGRINGVNYTIVDWYSLRALIKTESVITNVCVSKITDMSYLFDSTSSTYRLSFNQDISSWDVSNVTNMGGMFKNAANFNQSLNNWEVSNVTDMYDMFYNATSFNAALNNWDIGNVTNMSFMFYNAYAFNQDISSWDVSNVDIMSGMFYNTTSFNQPLNNWDVGNVLEMRFMFKKTTAFNQDISIWDVSSVFSMDLMFMEASSFNQDLSNWNVSNVFICGAFAALANNWTLPKPNFTNCTP